MKNKKTDWSFTRFVNGENTHPRNYYNRKRQGINVWPGYKGTYVRAIHGELSI